jgi:hypothetical protein
MSLIPYWTQLAGAFKILICGVLDMAPALAWVVLVASMTLVLLAGTVLLAVVVVKMMVQAPVPVPVRELLPAVLLRDMDLASEQLAQ